MTFFFVSKGHLFSTSGKLTLSSSPSLSHWNKEKNPFIIRKMGNKNRRKKVIRLVFEKGKPRNKKSKRFIFAELSWSFLFSFLCVCPQFFRASNKNGINSFPTRKMETRRHKLEINDLVFMFVLFKELFV